MLNYYYYLFLLGSMLVETREHVDFTSCIYILYYIRIFPRETGYSPTCVGSRDRSAFCISGEKKRQ